MLFSLRLHKNTSNGSFILTILSLFDFLLQYFLCNIHVTNTFSHHLTLDLAIFGGVHLPAYDITYAKNASVIFMLISSISHKVRSFYG